MKPIVSIIIPVYNAECYLRKCLNSILIQTFKEWECILIDDGSTDSSGYICDNYANTMGDKFIVIHQKNAGPNAARNQGLDVAQGEYVMFVDADDELYTNDTIEANLNHFTDDHKLDMVSMPQYTQIKDGGVLVHDAEQLKQSVLTNPKWIINKWVIANNIITIGLHSKVFRKEIFNGWRLEEDIRFGEDEYILPQLWERCKRILISPSGGYKYSFNNESATHSNFGDNKRYDIFQADLHVCEYLSNKPGFHKESTIFYSRAIFNGYYLLDTIYEERMLVKLSNIRPLYNLPTNITFKSILGLCVYLCGPKVGLRLTKRVYTVLSRCLRKK